MEEEKKEVKLTDSYTIGTAATGGAIKAYFEDIRSEDAIKKIDRAIELWKKALVLSGKQK